MRWPDKIVFLRLLRMPRSRYVLALARALEENGSGGKKKKKKTIMSVHRVFELTNCHIFWSEINGKI